MPFEPLQGRHAVKHALLRLGRIFPLLILTPIITASAGCQSPSANHSPSRIPTGVTNIAINANIIRSDVKRFGINLSGQTYYDSGIMMRDLAFRNPGFEGETWQTVLQCKFVNGDSCADNDEWSGWPADFAKGGSFEFFYGAAKGQTGIVSASSVAASALHQGIWVSFGKLAAHPQVGDFYILRFKIPGGAPLGWRTSVSAGATITTESKDISPASPGTQALRLNASGPLQSASIIADIDTWADRSFVQLNGTYTLSFRAKGLGGTNTLFASAARLSKQYGTLTYLTHQVPLSSSWQDFKFPVNVHENGTFIGPILVTLGINAGTALLDDVSFTESPKPDNPTAFRNAVVDRLRELHPGILRFMDNGTSFGSSLDNLLAPPFARQRSGYSEGNREQADIPIGLHEFLVLCQAVNAEPWVSLPVGISPAEMRNLIEYLAAPALKPYAARRIALGQATPWTHVFPAIHLELGNETWNWGSFAGEGIPEPKAYATRVAEIFAAAKAAPGYDPGKFDLIMNGWYAVPWWSEQELLVKSHADTIDIAPYTFNPFNDASSPEAIYGPMFAEPEALDSRPSGIVALDAQLAAKYGVKLSVYEVNLGTTEGKVNQAALESTIPSLGAGLSVADHMLLMLRDDGVSAQALFSLPEFANGFNNPDNPSPRELVKLWGTVVDMGGQTNRVRPTFLAEQLANSAILDKMLETTQSGANPTWDQAESTNAKIKLAGAHFIQSFAFSDSSRSSLVLFNLSRTDSLPVTFSGQAMPRGDVQVSRLTSAKITDSNETTQNVAITSSKLKDFNPASPYVLPPFSMTVLSWEADHLNLTRSNPDNHHPAPMHPVTPASSPHTKP